MALLITSPNATSGLTPRNISWGMFVLCLLLGGVVLFVAGAFLGARWHTLNSSTDEIELDHVSSAPLPVMSEMTAPQTLDTDYNGLPNIPMRRDLIERFGHLSGRVIELEANAERLIKRITAIEEFEKRLDRNTLEQIKGRLAKTQPGSAGGPFLPPRGGDMVESGMSSGVLIQNDILHLKMNVERLSQILEGIDRLATSFNSARLAFPGRSPMPGVRISSGFGNRRDPFSRRIAFHSGIDFPAPHGTPIFASAGGKVIFAARRRQYGKTVEIDHGGGLVTRYAHASKLYVKKGQVVLPGEKIAAIGTTGRSSGPHLHFEILRDGHFVNPQIYLSKF